MELPGRNYMDTLPQLNSSTLGSVLNDYINLLRDTLFNLSDTVKQTKLSDYLTKPKGYFENPLLRSAIYARIEMAKLMSASPLSVYSTPGAKFLDNMACEYWPPRSTTLPTLSLPNLVNVKEPATVRDLQITLPSMGRVQNLKTLSSYVRNVFNAWRERCLEQRLPSLLVCGGPGTGKTYFCRMGILEFFNKIGQIGDHDPFNMACALSAQKQLHLELSFSDGLVDGETTYPRRSFGLRITYEIFKDFTNFRRQYPTTREFLSAFMSVPTSDADHVELSVLSALLKTRLALPEDLSPILFVHLDDIEQILQQSNGNEGIVYLQRIAGAFDRVNLQQREIFFFPLFSGTGSTPIVEALRGRDYNRGGAFVIDLDLITPKEYCQGLSDFLSMQIGHGSKPSTFPITDICKGVRGTLMDIEGVPKLFITLLHVLSCLGGPQPISPSGSQFMDWSINRQRIREAVKDSSLSTSTILEALHKCITDSNLLPSWNASDDVEISMIWCYTITDTPIRRDARLDGRSEDSPTFSDLDRDGKVVLCGLPNNWVPMAFEHRVTFPFIFLKSILPREHVPPQSLLPNNCDPLYWKDVEEFDATWLLCRFKAFKDSGYTSQPLHDFLPMDAPCRKSDSLINLSGPIDDSLERLEDKPHDMVNRYRRLGKRGCFGWKNGLGAGGWDWALSLPLVDAGRLLLVGKRIEGSLSASRIESELKKVTATWFRTGMRVGHFVVLTDGRFEGTLSANARKMTSVVDRMTVDKLFGKIMAARLQAASDFRGSV
ncbi:hypothetical protein ARMSODRAFT_1025221 [Armillaria solidipes]|uniref:Uncharacterized protein n=1 Tax=Armillaria solidipes TaxID=1076256 RepID=A0A2H3BFP8_9AGAR|nr:hypothetical protein ARMSODRAFT_1025221 [Armillaria solidipes]